MYSYEYLISINHGPSLTTTNIGVIVKIPPWLLGSSRQFDLNAITEILPQEISFSIESSDKFSPEQLFIDLVRKLHSLNGASTLSIETVEISESEKYFILDYLNYHATYEIAKLSLDILSYALNSQTEPQFNLSNEVAFKLRQISYLLPGVQAMQMMEKARELNIPYYPIEKMPSSILYGQGKNAVLYDHVSSEFDSQIGVALQANKVRTNGILKLLGYPATDQYVAPNQEIYSKITKDLSFPYVVKPPASRLGKGVYCCVTNAKDAIKAFQYARKYSNDVVIVEEFVEGNDYRITVSSGKINAVTLNLPPSVVGDGIRTIRTLIDDENLNRKNLSDQEYALKEIEVDDLTLLSLKKDGLSLDDVPEEGAKIILRGNSNLGTGGTRQNINPESVHPDNLEMAVSISKALRLDAIGVDFMTPDISKSWQSCGKILEINTRPLLTPAMVEKLLKDQFADRNFGRIKADLIVSDDNSWAFGVFEKKYGNSIDIGYTDTNNTTVNGKAVILDDRSIYQRCLALLMRPELAHIVVAVSPEEIRKNGLPLDQFDRCFYDRSIEEKMPGIKELISTIIDQIDYIE